MKRTPLRKRRAPKEHPRPIADDRRMPRVVDQKYLDFVASNPCCAGHLGRCEGDVVPHHYPQGHGFKDDMRTVPLCFEHHSNQVHQHGHIGLLTRDETLVLFRCQQLHLLVVWRDAA